MKRALLLLCAAPLFALDNSVTIRNNYTEALTDHPIAFGRWFARGEIANFAKPYATPSDTGTRAAASTWQVTELNRWNDTSAPRTITGGRVGATGKTWTSGGGGITNIVVTAGIATITFTSDHNLAVGDRLVITWAGGAGSTTYVYGSMDNVTVSTVPSSTTVTYISRGTTSTSYVYVTSGTYTAGITVAQKLDPQSPTDACRFTSANHGFYKGDPVVIADVEGLTGANGSFIITGVTRNEFVVNGSCSGTYTEGGTATGTSIGAGSLRFARIALIATVPNGGTTKVDFQNSTDPCSSGNAAACAAAGFDEDEMLDAEWNFNLIATADVKSGSTPAITTSARTMLEDSDTNFETASYCGPRIWARGPVDSVLILEYGCSGTLEYDFGWKIRPGTTFTATIAAADTQLPVASVDNISVGTVLWLTSATFPYPVETVTVTALTCASNPPPGAPCVTVTRATSGTATTYANGATVGIKQWEDAPSAAYRSLHPIFTLRFINGWDGVGGRIEVKNDWIWKNQNLWYSVDLQTGDTPASRITKTTFKHLNSTSWQLSTWDGDDPDFYCSTGGDPDNGCSGVRKRKYLIDYNTPYLFYARVLPEMKLFPSKSTSLDSFATGYASSDKGGISSGSLGGGTFGALEADTGTSQNSPIKGSDGAQEAYVLNDRQAMCLQNWSAACFEIVFGDSNPGGGGNAEAQRHIPIHYREDDDTTAQPRFIMPGFGAAADRAHNRALSLYSRPTWVAATITTNNSANSFDTRRTACTDAAPATTPQEGNQGSNFTSTRGWPCYWGKSVGNDGWDVNTNLESHQGEENALAYLLTADPHYLTEIQNNAAWNNGWEMGLPGRVIGRSWAQSEPQSGSLAARAQGSWTRSQLEAAIWTPNVPQFGYTVPSVETFYWNEKLWDMAFTKEAAWDLTTGHFATMYPAANRYSGGACAGTGTNATNAENIWTTVRCTINQNKSNPMGVMMYGSSHSCPGDGSEWMNCAGPPYYTEMGYWYGHHNVVQWSRAAGMGLTMFDHVRQKWANYSFSLFGSANWNPFLNDLSQVPNKYNGEFVATLAEQYAGIKATWTGGGCSPKTRETWCTPTNKLYGTQFRAGLAVQSDLARTVTGNLDGCAAGNRTPRGCAFDHAWGFINRTIGAQNTWGSIVKYMLEPRADINDLTCTPGATTAICTFTAPTNDAGTYAVVATGTGFANTLDASDTAITCSARRCRFVITGLTAATGYTVRVTAGQRLATFSPTAATGTGRTTTTLTTLAAEGAASDVTVRAMAPAGATTATLEYGTTSSLGSTLAPGAVACTSGCSFDVPGNARQLVYYRITFKTAGGTTVAQGNAQPVLVP